jgi:hypothetical protein
MDRNCGTVSLGADYDPHHTDDTPTYVEARVLCRRIVVVVH